MAAPLSGRRILSFLLFFGGSMLGAFFVCRYLNIDVLGAVTGQKPKKKDDETEAEEETLVSETPDEEIIDNLIRSELFKAASLAFTIPQPDLVESVSDEALVVDSRKVEAPVIDPRKVEALVVDPRKVEALVVDPRKVEAPVVDPRKVEAPVVDPRKVEAPVVDQEKVETITDEAPVVDPGNIDGAEAVLAVETECQSDQASPAKPERTDSHLEGDDSVTPRENGISQDDKVKEYIDNLVNTVVASRYEPVVMKIEETDGETERLEETVLTTPASHGDQAAATNENNSNANYDDDYSLLGYDESFSLDTSPVKKPANEFDNDKREAVEKSRSGDSGDGVVAPGSFDPKFDSLQEPSVSERGDSGTSDFSLLSAPDEATTGVDDDLSIGAVLFGAEDDDVISPVASPVGRASSPGGMEIRETFAIIQQYGGGALTDKHARVLVKLMSSQNDDDVVKVLNVIQNCAAFTSSQNFLREAGCLIALNQTLRDLTMASSTANRSKMAAVNGAIANLSVNEENQKTLQECIPALIDLLGMEEPDRATRLSGLRALTNLSTTPRYHGSYTRAIQELYSLLSTDDSAISRQAASVLVNLSTNDEMVPHLLAAKSPERGVAMLLSTDQLDLLLRLIAFLANITTSVHQRKLDPSQLPVDEKAASPETMYTALYGIDNMKVKSKVFVLLQHENEEIRQNAKRTYSCLSGS